MKLTNLRTPIKDRPETSCMATVYRLGFFDWVDYVVVTIRLPEITFAQLAIRQETYQNIR